MALKNTLKPTPVKADEKEMMYMVGGEEIKLTPNIVRDYMVSGSKESVSIQELVMYMRLCKANGLNPWNKEAYLIKYGTEPATMVISQQAYMNRAESNPNFDGYIAGIVVLDEESGEIEYRNGALVVDGEKVVGGWAEVYRKDRTHQVRIEVTFNEYAGRKKDGSLNGQWNKMPATMIRKVAKVQALREAFPKDLGNLYVAEEFGMDETSVAATVEAEVVEREEPKPTPAPQPTYEGDSLL